MCKWLSLKHENSDKEAEKEDEMKSVEAEELKNKANELFKGIFIKLSPQM